MTVNLFATDWYVKNGGSGSNNGTSWANAWTSFSSISWGSISAGDRLFIDGGADSVVYNMTMNIQASGTWNNYIQILPGKYSPSPSGHSGKVIIDHNKSGGNNGIQILGSTHGILIKGLIIRRTGSSGIYMYANATSANPHRIKIDSCQIYDVGQNECVEMLGYYSGSPTATNMGMMDTTHHIHHIEISRCYMVSPLNAAVNETNLIYAHLTGNVWIHHNTLWERNLQQGGNDHIDPIQLSYSNYGWKIYNNIMLSDSCVTGHTMILGLMSRGSNYHDTTLVYNNYIYSGGEYNCQTNWKQEILWRAPEGDNPSGVQYRPLVYSINNTIVARNGYVANSAAEGEYNPQESNNIFAHYGVNGSEPANHIGFVYSTYSAGDYKQVDSNRTNLYYMAWGGVDFGGNRWRGAGGSPTGNPSSWSDFINNWGGNGVNANPKLINNTRIPTGQPFEIDATSPAIDAGTDMSYILNKFSYLPMFDATSDILGNPRNDNWDIGAFEYQSGVADTVPSFNFSAVNNANLNTVYTASATFSGADSTFHVWTTTGARFNINSNTSLTTTPKTAVNGDVVYVENVSSAFYSTGTSETIIAGGVSRSFNVTTKSEPVLTSGTKKVRLSNGKVLKDSSGKVIKVQ